MEGHMAFVPVPEIAYRILRPLVRLGEEHPVLELAVDIGPEFFQKRIGFRKVLAVGVSRSIQIGDSVQPQSVDAHLEPEIDDLEHRLLHIRVVEIEIGLMGVETMPVVSLCDRVPCPVRGLEILEYDPCVLVFFRGIAPDIKIPPGEPGFGLSRFLEPWMLVRGMVQDKLGNDPDASFVGFSHELLEIPQHAVRGMHIEIIGDIVAVVPERRRIKGKKPDGSDSEVFEIIEFPREPLRSPDAVATAVKERLDVEFINNRVLIPERIVSQEMILSVPFLSFLT